MPTGNNATLSDVIQAQNAFIAEQSQKIATLEQNNATALQNLSALGQRVYGYNHTDFAVADIDAVYNDIIAENPLLVGKSAVGYTAILATGDTVVKQTSRMFIQGKSGSEVTEETTDSYTFTGTNGYEYVTVWHFADGDTLGLNNPVGLNILNLIIRQRSNDIILDTSYYNYAKELFVDGNFTFTTLPAVAKNIKFNTLTNQSLGANLLVDEYTLKSVSTMENQGDILIGNTNVKKIILPDLTDLTSNRQGSSQFSRCSNAEVICPKLQTVKGHSAAPPVNGGWIPFSKINKLVLPSTVTKIEGCIVTGVTNLILECKDASISHTWCNSSTTNSAVLYDTPTCFSLCPDWGSTINLQYAATRWNPSDFTNLIGGKTGDVDNLRTMTSDNVKTLTVPGTATTGIYNDLNTTFCTVEGYEELTWIEYAAQVKHWTIAHA